MKKLMISILTISAIAQVVDVKAMAMSQVRIASKPVLNDAGDKTLGSYIFKGTTPEGYNWGVFRRENRADTTVVENGKGTPASQAVSGASKTIVGYINVASSGMFGSASRMALLKYKHSDSSDADVSAQWYY